MIIESKCSNLQKTFLLLLIFLLTLAACLFQANNSYAQKATIGNFTVSNSESRLLLYFTVNDVFTDEMKTAIHNGISATFTFHVGLYEVKKKWPDKKITEHIINHTIEYDSLKKEYLVRRSEKNDAKLTPSLEEARSLMSEINGFKVLQLNELDPQVTYALRVKAELARKTLPLYFHYVIPFSSPWNFETDWHEIKLELAL